MRKVVYLILMMLFICSNLIADDKKVDSKIFTYAGLYSYGGSMIGSEVEFLVTDRFGISAGLGFMSINMGFLYHLKPGGISPYLYTSYNISLFNNFKLEKKPNQSIIIGIGSRTTQGFEFKTGIEYNHIMSDEKKEMFNFPVMRDILPFTFVLSAGIKI